MGIVVVIGLDCTRGRGLKDERRVMGEGRDDDLISSKSRLGHGDVDEG